MRAPLNGRAVAIVLRSLATATLLGATGCESVFHWCMNGSWGAPYWAKNVIALPANAPNANPISARDCATLCGTEKAERCEIAEVPGESYLVCFIYRENGCPSGWGSGRMLDGIALEPRRAATVGEYFARAAALEAASVVSFRRLAADLERHGAPRGLVARARSAARDEKRHAALARALSKRFGGRPVRARVPPARPRGLEELAHENAWTGCVGETIGALLLFARAAVTTDEQVRAALREMATDEIGHAALAWDVRAFLRGRLDLRARREELAALEAAVASARGIAFDPVFPFDPGPIVAGLDAALWQDALSAT